MKHYPDEKTLKEFANRSFCSGKGRNLFLSETFGGNTLTFFSGFCDVHVHLREPGFFYKETINSGTAAAARGGYTAVCSMPNLNPVPDSLSHLLEQKSIIDKDALVNVYPYGSITVGEKGKKLSDMEVLSPYVCAFSDDGKGVRDERLMLAAMKKAKSLGKIIAAHCEDESLLFGGYIHDGEYASAHGHKGISSESEWKQIERDVSLLRETGVSYHVCHVSTKESVEIIRRAKREGLDITCETAPHYLILDDSYMAEDGRFKMNPPLRSKEDRLALLDGILDGTVDMIATDHAPHSAEEKSRGLKDSLMGVTGLETAFPVLYTKLVKTGSITLEKLIKLLVVNPRARFGIPLGKDYSVWDLNCEYTVNPAEFLSKGKSTPFEGMKVFGKNLFTVCGGRTVYSDLEN